MFFSKSFALLTALIVAAGSASASPLANRQAGPLCHYTMTPSAPVPAGANLVGEMNYAIGRELAIEVPSHTINNDGCTTVPQADGMYKTDCNIAVVGWTNAQTAALVETWTGKVVQGFSVPEWTIDAVHCDA